MSRLTEDLNALRAMAASRMAPASMARLLQRSDAWVARQLELLDRVTEGEGALFARGVEAALALAVRFGNRAAGLAKAFARGAIGRARAPRKTAAERSGAFVERTFATWPAGRGAAVWIGDGRLAFVDNVGDLAVGDRVAVVAEPGRFVLTREGA